MSISEMNLLQNLLNRNISDKSMRKGIKQYFNRLLLMFIYMIAFPIIPAKVCDTVLTIIFIANTIPVFINPTRLLFQVEWKYKLFGVCQLICLGIPLVFDDDSWWDILVYLGIIVPFSFIFGIMARIRIGRMGPNELLTRILIYGGILDKAIIVIDPGNVLKSSIPEVLKLEGKYVKKSKSISVSYRGNDEEIQQEGIDAGGIFRDWFERMMKAFFLPENKYLKNNVEIEGNIYYRFALPGEIKKLATLNGIEPVDIFKCLGRMVAMSIAYELPIGVKFAPPILKRMVDRSFKCSYHEYQWIHPTKYKYFTDPSNTDYEALDVHFEADDLSELSKGSPAVTPTNVTTYMSMMVEYEFNSELSKAFYAGFHDIHLNIPKNTNVNALSNIICGEFNIAVNEWKSKMEVQFVAKREKKKNTEESKNRIQQRVVRYFWQYMEELDQEKLADVFFWITSRRRLPAGGFPCDWKGKIYINENFDRTSLPVAHTCFNQIDLPCYENYDMLKKSVNYAVENCKEFFLA